MFHGPLPTSHVSVSILLDSWHEKPRDLKLERTVEIMFHPFFYWPKLTLAKGLIGSPVVGEFLGIAYKSPRLPRVAISSCFVHRLSPTPYGETWLGQESSQTLAGGPLTLAARPVMTHGWGLFLRVGPWFRCLSFHLGPASSILVPPGCRNLLYPHLWLPQLCLLF